MVPSSLNRLITRDYSGLLRLMGAIFMAACAVAGAQSPLLTAAAAPAPTPTPAPQPQALELVGRLSGNGGGSFAVAGDHLYMAAGKAGLRIIDVSDRARPFDVGLYSTPRVIGGVALSGPYVLVSVDDKTLRVLDVADPARPVEVGRYAAPDQIADIAVGGHYVYLAAGSGGLRVVDISTPTGPVEVGAYIAFPANRIALANHYVYLNNEGGLRIIDVADPARPTAVPAATPSNIYGLKIEGQNAYLFDASTYKIEIWKIMDVSDPAAPLLRDEVKSWDPVRNNLIAAHGRYLFTVGYSGLEMTDVSTLRHIIVGRYPISDAASLQVEGDYLYVSTQSGELLILRINPVIVPQPTAAVITVNHVGGQTNAIYVGQDGHYAYLNFGPELAILDVSNPARPTRVGYLLLPGEAIQSLYVAGHYAFVGMGADYWVVDVANPARPVQVGHRSFSRDEASWTSINGITVAGDYAYLAVETCSQPGSHVACQGFFKVLSFPLDPISVQSLPSDDCGAGAKSVTVVGNYAYVANSFEGGSATGCVSVFDVAKPSEPVKIGSSKGDNPLDNRPIDGMVVRDGYAYITGDDDYSTGAIAGSYRILDVSNPAAIKQVASFKTPGPTRSIASAGHYLYMAEDAGLDKAGQPASSPGLRILDVTRPLSPSPAGFYPTSDGITTLAVREHYAYLATGGGQLRILDVSDAAAPVQVGEYGEFNSLGHLASVDDDVLLSYRAGGKELRVINTSTPLTPTVAQTITLASDPITLAVVSPYAYVMDQAGLRTIDISKPAAPVEVSRYQSAQPVSHIAAGSHWVYLAGGSSLQVLDVSAPAAPRAAAHYDLPPGLQLTGLTLIKDYLYVSHRGGTLILNVSNPAAPTLLPASPDFTPGEKFISHGEYVYFPTNGLQVWNVSDPARPVQVGATGFGLSGANWGDNLSGTVAGDFAYLGNEYSRLAQLDGGQSLKIVNISDPAAPTEVADYSILGYYWGVAAVRNYVYLSTESGLFILKVAPGR